MVGAGTAAGEGILPRVGSGKERVVDMLDVAMGTGHGQLGADVMLRARRKNSSGNGPMVTGSCSPCASSEQSPRHTTATATPTLEASHLTTSFRRLSSVIALAGLNVSFTLLNR